MSMLRLAILMSCLAFSSNSFSGLLIEPYIGTGMYSTSIDAATASSYEASTDSVSTIGGRLGASFILLSAGIDYSMDTMSGGSRSNTAVFVGVDMPILIRGYAKYIINSDYKDDDIKDAGFDIAFDSGYAIGLGFTGLPLISINLEMESSKYKLEYPGASDIDNDWVSYMLTVSLPLDF